tara:strand:- start:1 stop:1095 length:1095 start_codon:yes stop_codon:yes gene_type:complete
MAYQNVGTPRFYISILQWLKSLGMASYSDYTDWTPSGDASSLLDINPSSTITFTKTGGSGNNDHIKYQTDMPLGNIMPTKKNFFMVLGHNFRAATVSDLVVRDDGGTEVCTTELVNMVDGNVYNGFTIMRGNDATDIDDNYLIFSLNGASNAYATDIKIGSFLYGTYFDMPHSPDLSLTMTREYGGIKTIQTKGGASFSNAFYTKPPAWGNLGAWELSDYTTNQKLSRSGRRVWDLSFSYLQDSDVFGSNQMLSNLHDPSGNFYYPIITEDGYDTSDVVTAYGYTYNLLTDDNFYSQVIHKTNGGQLPFIFQPDAPRLNASTGLYEGGNNNPDQFAICKFDSGFKFEQVANSVYNVKLKIREVW